jgi:hypothetical protein
LTFWGDKHLEKQVLTITNNIKLKNKTIMR